MDEMRRKLLDAILPQTTLSIALSISVTTGASLSGSFTTAHVPIAMPLRVAELLEKLSQNNKIDLPHTLSIIFSAGVNAILELNPERTMALEEEILAFAKEQG